MSTLGHLEPATGSYFVSAYPPFACWTEAAIPAYEGRLAAPSGEADEFGLYVHIPFCAERCHYCYYLSYADSSGEIDRYLDSLLLELELYRRQPALAGRHLSFAYFGGGTPSLLSTSRIRRLLGGLQAIVPWSGAREVTFECAPRTVSEEKLDVLRSEGVTRISLGIQQLDDRVLALNGRIHRVEDVRRAWKLLRVADFDVVNVDLIAGLVGETEESFQDSLSRVIGMGPESVTIYLLEAPWNTPLFRSIQEGSLLGDLPDWKAKRGRLAWAFERLEAAGYTVRSAYTAVRDPAAHAFVYQDEQYRGADLIGLGASSFSYLEGVHQQNAASLDRYLAALSEGKLPLWRGYELGPEERFVRELVLRLKLGGCDWGELGRKFGEEVTGRYAAPLARLAAEGWLVRKGDEVRMTRPGLLRVDRLIERLYLPEHQQAMAYPACR